MKNIYQPSCLFILASLLFFACNKGEQQSELMYTEVQFSIDTVMVDAGDELYIYDPASRTLAEKSWDGPLVGKQRTYMGPKSVEGESPQQYDEMRKVEEDFTFMSFLWDAQHERYYRFAYKKTFGEEKEEWGFYKATGMKLYLSVFDKDLQLLVESLVPVSLASLSKAFVKDGKIWIYQNMEDELGFVRLKVSL